MKKIIKKLPLHDIHLGLSAKMGDFAGWKVPLFYKSIIEEYKHCREKVALFDISHMGEFIFEGDIKKSGLEEAVTPWIKKIPLGRSRYGFILNQAGGIIDDLVIFKINESKIMFVVNAASESIDYQILQERITGGKLENISAKTAKIDLQGPLAKEILVEVLNFKADIPYFSFKEFNYQGEKLLISRTGYTGELGYEIFIPNNLASFVWDQFINNKDVMPAGFAARDILRLEMGYSLMGNELKNTITPIEAGLGKFINFNKDFVGKTALLKQKEEGVAKIKVAFSSSSRRIPRSGYKIYDQDREIGEVTSGTFSSCLCSGIGLGYINSDCTQPMKNIFIGDEKKIRFGAEVVELPFYKQGSLKKDNN
ncbi:MAG: glycine cleavage system aminomethyltransferase GcvT [Candidatus Omnitrophica bacterium]|nr:glycine cleavage system aminomethyltransferase GcvT [Candidatus Omnitrophota bacterium]